MYKEIVITVKHTESMQSSFLGNSTVSLGTGGASAFITRADFESIKHDPMIILERGTQFIALLEQQEQALSEENKALQQHLRQETERVTFTPEQHATLVETAAELELDHRELSQKFVDLEHVNKMLQGVVEALRNDKQRLLDELQALKTEQSDLVASYTRLTNSTAELDEQREARESRLKVQQEEITKKIDELDDYTKRIVEATQKTIELQDATEKIGSGRLALEAETTALEQATQQQERTLSYLQGEVNQLDSAIKRKADEMVQLKKQMSASILELQLQITKSEEEMSRIRTTVANEKDLTGRQNLWLAKDLQNKTQELLLTRQEMTKENAELKAELVVLREKASRLKANVLVVEKRNQVLHDDLKRLEAEDTFVKESYGKRKDAAYLEMNEQAAIVSTLNADLQTAREDLYMIKSKLCKNCRGSILGGAAVNPVHGAITQR